MKLQNSLKHTKDLDEFIPAQKSISIYSCGPTVYNNLHIGNLSAFIYADVLRRALATVFPDAPITHVMNITDVDDKTIRDSALAHPGIDPKKALLTFTRHYEDVFMTDIAKVGNDIDAFTFIRATDSIVEMQELIDELYKKKVAYLTDDGIYFSIEEYQKLGKIYGQLVDLEPSSQTRSRIANDEYDKDAVNDFALWKKAKAGEPSWDFVVDGTDVSGRPGWHIECSAMSRKILGQQFDIHTGGIDLKFPHHENEIAQSTACSDSDVMARFFVHNNHVLVDGVKMSKSLGNFFTLRDLEDKGIDPLAFRLLVLQGHYSNSVNFSWENVESATSRLNRWRRIAVLRHQAIEELKPALSTTYSQWRSTAVSLLQNNLAIPELLSHIDGIFESVENGINQADTKTLTELLTFIDSVLGIRLIQSTPDVNKEIAGLLAKRAEARNSKNFELSDNLRDQLDELGVDVRDTSNGQIWNYTFSRR